MIKVVDFGRLTRLNQVVFFFLIGYLGLMNWVTGPSTLIFFLSGCPRLMTRVVILMN